jgi:hypothetical protein
MHIIQPIGTRARHTAVAAALCLYPLLAACGRGGDADTTKTGAAQADSAAVDTSAMAVAQRRLGPEVRMAIPFRIPNRSAHFVAAALPIMDWVPDVARSGSNVAPGGHEMVILEAIGETFAVHKPGLYASREPFLPRLDDTATVVPADSATLAKTMGVEDADGDGAPEVWAAQYLALPRGGHTWDVRAYDRDNRTMYQVTATGAEREYSASVEQNPAMRQWLEVQVARLEASLASAPAGTGR